MEISFLRFFKKQSVHSFTSEQVLSQAVLGCIAGGKSDKTPPPPPPPKPAPLPQISGVLDADGGAFKITYQATDQFNIGVSAVIPDWNHHPSQVMIHGNWSW